MTEKSKGFYGWKLVGVFFLISFLNGSFPVYGGTVINTLMAEQMGFDRSVLGLGYTVLLVAIGVTAPLVGSIVTRIGVRLTLLVGSALLSTSTLLMAFAVSKPWHYVLVFGVLTGSCYGLGSLIPIQAGVTVWFKRKKALALSFVLTSTGVGGAARGSTGQLCHRQRG